ncbi:MIF4G like-domain-containing protein [Mycena floridula]|nr:MIF4G like-domain-containing protein [Mycena floridula]
MSYHDRPNRGRRRYRDDYDDRRREPIESPQERVKNAIIKLGEVDPLEELPTLEQQIRDTPLVITNISEGFLIGVTEQPYKIPYYSALLFRLHRSQAPEADAEVGSSTASIGRQILEDFWKGFQAYVDKLAWSETRMCIHFFAHLTSAKLVSPESFLALLQSFTTVLDEFGVSHGRAQQAALCAAEGLMIAGRALKATSSSSVSEIITAIANYSESTSSPKWIVQPTLELHSTSTHGENVDELLEVVLASLKALDITDFVESSESFVRPYSQYADIEPDFSAFVVPSVLVPPEVIELDGLAAETGEDSQVKKDEWPIYFLRLFENDITPDPNVPGGYAVRQALLAIIDIFEVNRKECARILLEYPKWVEPGTFKARPGATSVPEPIPGKEWQLESTILETILGAFFILPEPSKKSIYYIALITELCKLSPATVGPALGKSIRKLYATLADGMDVDISRRFAEWFATHMSNFAFQWVWKEWIPDLELAIEHPKRAFMRRAIEYEIRLSYFERVAKTLPEEMQKDGVHILPEQAPTPNFEYEDPSKPHHDAAQSVLDFLRGRATAEDVISHLDSLKTQLDASEDGHINVDATLRSITIQSLLHIGSRSFSHLLNAIERYLPLLRNMTTGSPSGGTGNPEIKAEVLTAAATFWKYNPQMVGIVFDKLMQYQIVDPQDVVAWTFQCSQAVFVSSDETVSPSSISSFAWDLLKGALDKANGRLMIARRKVTALRKEDDETRARGEVKMEFKMEVDVKMEEAEVKQEEAPAVENAALSTALKAFTSLTKEQKAALSRTLDGFVSCLAPPADSSSANPQIRNILSEKAWHNRANWSRDEWNAWETWGWYRQFCRAYAPYLRNYSTTLSTVSFSHLDKADPAAALVQKMFGIVTGEY